MAVYNEPEIWLRSAIESILNQTVRDFEFIVALDNPDNIFNLNLLREYEKLDPRVKLLINKKNMGITFSINACLEASSGEYIARMDADDISDLSRFEMQLNYLNKNKDVDIVGSNVQLINEHDCLIGTTEYLNSKSLILKTIAFRSPVCQPTLLAKRKVFDLLDGYREFPTAEDYDFLYRAIDAGFSISNVNLLLLKYRVRSDSLSHDNNNIRYRIRGYIKSLHDQRIELGEDKYDKSEVDFLVENSFDNATMDRAINSIKASSGIKKLVIPIYIFKIWFVSPEFRARVKEELMYRLLVFRHKTMAMF